MPGPDRRRTGTDARGAHPHAHWVDEYQNRLGIAILYDDFLGRVEQELASWSQPLRRKGTPIAMCCAGTTCAAPAPGSSSHQIELAILQVLDIQRP